MKKLIIYIAVALCFGVFLSGCGGSISSSQEDSIFRVVEPKRSNFVPTPRVPLDIDTEILQVYLAELNFKYDWNLTLDDVWIENYYGAYNGCVAVLPYNIHIVPGEGVYINDELEVVVGGVSFFYGPLIHAEIVVYKDGIIYGLQEAYDYDFLTNDDLENIAYYQNEGITFPKRTARTPRDGKIVWNGSINDAFDDRTILIVIDGNFTGLRFYAGDFTGIDVVRVRALSVLRLMAPWANLDSATWRDIISIEIGNPGKQNVINAIRRLENFDFVMAAGPNHFHSPGIIK